MKKVRQRADPGTSAPRRRRAVEYVLLFVGCVLFVDALVGEKGLLAIMTARREYQVLERSLAGSPLRELAAARGSPPPPRGSRRHRGPRAPRARPHPPGRKAIHRQGRAAHPRLTTVYNRTCPPDSPPPSTAFVPRFGESTTRSCSWRSGGRSSNSRRAALAADNSTRYIATNASARELLGFSNAECLQMTVMDATPLPRTEAGRRLWQDFIAHGIQRGDMHAAAQGWDDASSALLGLRERRARLTSRRWYAAG